MEPHALCLILCPTWCLCDLLIVLYLPFLFFFFFTCSIGAWTQGLHLEPLHQPCFCERFLEIGSCELFAWAGFELLASWSAASWVAKITSVSHQYPACTFLLITVYYFLHSLSWNHMTWTSSSFLAGLGLKSGPHLQSRHSATWAVPPVHFALVILEILEIRSGKLFAWIDLRVQSFQVARITGVSHQHLSGPVFPSSFLANLEGVPHSALGSLALHRSHPSWGDACLLHCSLRDLMTAHRHQTRIKGKVQSQACVFIAHLPLLGKMILSKSLSLHFFPSLVRCGYNSATEHVALLWRFSTMNL
jgi:hypothetical protein